MARFRHQFRVNAPLSAVWHLHESPKALPELTPPPVTVKIVRIDQPLKAGSHLIFRLSLGPVGVLWNAVYDEFEPYRPGLTRCGFVDRSARSPFRFWMHRHTFDDLGDGTSAITDDVRFALFGGSLGSLVTWVIVWPAIAFMFLYRRFRTHQMLAKGWRP
ncbi:MAG: SRPBCC family protein [Anaerolineae bacterium]|nr:SRPBCC family protein [Anaerolineae bacterium]